MLSFKYGLHAIALRNMELVVSGVVSRRNVERVAVALEGPDEIFAGEPARFTLRLTNHGRLPRRALLAQISGSAAPILFGSIGPSRPASRGVDLIFPKRGRRKIESILVYSGYPIGLFRKGRLHHLDEERIVIDPYDDSLLQPSSVDVRVDRFFRVFHNARYAFIDVKEPQEELTELVEIDDERPFILHPGEFVLGSTLERIALPDDPVARLEGKSSPGRLGLLIHSTAGFIDPGWDGHVTLEHSIVPHLPIPIYRAIKLGQTAVRLEEAMAARRHLLNNIAAGGDEARRRFATALHDDSLQLLTGAELQLERLRLEVDGSPYRGQLDQLRQTLRRVEDSLRRLLTNVSPEPLQLPASLREAISERLESMRVQAGIEPTNDSSLPDDLPLAIQAIAMKNIGEALNNVEKHARATRVQVVAKVVDGGIRVQVIDDGTGFVVAEAARVPGHIGLVAMRERAQLAGGWCRIESDPGTGTKVDFWVPMSL